MILQKQTKTKTRKRKRMTVQYNESDVFTNCIKTYRKTLNRQILEQILFFNDGIKNLPTYCTVTKKQLKEMKKKLSMESKSKFALVPFFCLGEEFQNQLATISICANVHIHLILPRYCQMSLVTANDTNEHFTFQVDIT